MFSIWHLANRVGGLQESRLGSAGIVPIGLARATGPQRRSLVTILHGYRNSFPLNSA